MALSSQATQVGAYVALAGGAPLVLLGFRGLWEAWETRTWPSVEGRILSAGATLNSASEISDGYSPVVSYEYLVNGSVHRGTRMIAGARTFHPSYPTVAAAVGGYRARGSCRVYYDPARPGSAVLKPGATFMHYVMPTLGALLLAAGVGGLIWG